MSCPTCGNDLTEIPLTETAWLCRRCGTVMSPPDGEGECGVYVPQLVERCREFGRQLDLAGHDSQGMLPALRDDWKKLSIPECLTHPVKS